MDRRTQKKQVRKLSEKLAEKQSLTLRSEPKPLEVKSGKADASTKKVPSSKAGKKIKPQAAKWSPCRICGRGPQDSRFGSHASSRSLISQTIGTSPDFRAWVRTYFFDP